MPQIVVVPGILAAARNAIEILLKFKGVEVVLTPAKGATIQKPSGGDDFTEGVDRAPQLISLSKIGADVVSDGENDEQRYVIRNYILTGRHDMLIAIGDRWSDSEADYRVDTLDQTNGYKTSADVVGYIKLAD